MPRYLASFAVVTVSTWLAVAAPLAAQTEEIIAFGDSITWGLGDTNAVCPGDPSGAPPRSGGYPPRLVSRLGNRGIDSTIQNSGVCGETTSQGVSRLPGVLAQNPNTDVVVIMEGTNDLSDRDISTESMRFNIRTMVETTLEAEIWPVLASPIPRSPEAAGSNTRTAFLTSLIEEDAMVAGIDFANPFDDMIDIVDLYDRFYADPYHPNASGYDVLTASLEDATVAAANRPPIDLEPCAADAETLCLTDERFEVTVDFVDGEGMAGVGQAVPRTSDTGFFWFFDEANIELVIKVLDGRAINGAFWVFYGALSDVEYAITVRDTVTGESQVYENPEGNLASRGDTFAFPDDGDDAMIGGGPVVEAGILQVAWPPVGGLDAGTATPCAASDERLCLNADRFAVTVGWRNSDGDEGVGTAVPITSDTGYFWFFEDSNIELVVKVLDGTGINGNYWVFYGSLSNVAYDIEVVDTETGAMATYTNPLDQFGSRADTAAFTQP